MPKITQTFLKTGADIRVDGHWIRWWNFSRILKCHQSGKLFDVNQFERVDPC